MKTSKKAASYGVNTPGKMKTPKKPKTPKIVEAVETLKTSKKAASYGVNTPGKMKTPKKPKTPKIVEAVETLKNEKVKRPLDPKGIFVKFDDDITGDVAKAIIANCTTTTDFAFSRAIKIFFEDEASATEFKEQMELKAVEFAGQRPLWCYNATERPTPRPPKKQKVIVKPVPHPKITEFCTITLVQKKGDIINKNIRMGERDFRSLLVRFHCGITRDSAKAFIEHTKHALDIAFTRILRVYFKDDTSAREFRRLMDSKTVDFAGEKPATTFFCPSRKPWHKPLNVEALPAQRPKNEFNSKNELSVVTLGFDNEISRDTAKAILEKTETAYEVAFQRRVNIYFKTELEGKSFKRQIALESMDFAGKKPRSADYFPKGYEAMRPLVDDAAEASPAKKQKVEKTEKMEEKKEEKMEEKKEEKMEEESGEEEEGSGEEEEGQAAAEDEEEDDDSEEESEESDDEEEEEEGQAAAEDEEEDDDSEEESEESDDEEEEEEEDE